MAVGATGVISVVPQGQKKPKRIGAFTTQAPTSTVWSSAAAYCTVQCARGHTLDIVVNNCHTGQRQTVHWDAGNIG